MQANHQTVPVESGYRCTVCGQTWKNLPVSECPGVKMYGWGQWPEHLLTKKQMDEAGFQTGTKLPPPAGAVWRHKSPDGKMWLYDRNQGVPKKQMSDEARANLKAAAEKSRAGWYCICCGRATGWVDSRGYFHAQHLNPPGLCERCADLQSAQEWARRLLAGEFVVLDTETTGLSAGHDEIVQIAVINQAGETLLDTYVNARHPEHLMERHDGVSASDINGITPDILLNAPVWSEVYVKLVEIVAGRKVVIYNAEFDEAMIAGDCERFGIQHAPFDTTCAMLMYAQFYGQWSSYWGNYKWQPLNGGHTALEDCRACLEVIREMAKGDKPEVNGD